jgi:hypothetical protein
LQEGREFNAFSVGSISFDFEAAICDFLVLWVQTAVLDALGVSDCYVGIARIFRGVNFREGKEALVMILKVERENILILMRIASLLATYTTCLQSIVTVVASTNVATVIDSVYDAKDASIDRCVADKSKLKT